MFYETRCISVDIYGHIHLQQQNAINLVKCCFLIKRRVVSGFLVFFFSSPGNKNGIGAFSNPKTQSLAFRAVPLLVCRTNQGTDAEATQQCSTRDKRSSHKTWLSDPRYFQVAGQQVPPQPCSPQPKFHQSQRAHHSQVCNFPTQYEYLRNYVLDNNIYVHLVNADIFIRAISEET